MTINMLRRRRLKEQEERLKILGLQKCKECKTWMDKKHIKKSSTCWDCLS